MRKLCHVDHIIFLLGATALEFHLCNKLSTHFTDEKTELTDHIGDLNSGNLALEAMPWIPAHIPWEINFGVPSGLAPSLWIPWAQLLMEKARTIHAPAPEGVVPNGPKQLQFPICSNNLCHRKVLSAATWHCPSMWTRANFGWDPSAGKARTIVMLRGRVFAWVTGTLLGLVSRGWGPAFPRFGPFTPSDWWLLLGKRSPTQLSPAPVHLSAAAEAILVSFISPLA